MSSNVPPPPPDVLDSSGAAAAPPPPPKQPGSRRGLTRGLLVGGGVVLLGAVGYGAWAAYSFFQTGDQPAEALPASTLGYVSIDLDPSGGQKIEALRTLNKFPAFKDKVGVTSSDDLRTTLFDAVHASDQCPGLDYAQDVEPWLGERAAVAAVQHGSGEPTPVVVVQVTDDAKAEKGLATLRDCAEKSGSGSDSDLGWHIDGDWAVLAQSTSIADQVADDASKDSLADDGDFKHWADEVGDQGVVSMYAAPAAGDYLADHAEDLGRLPLPGAGEMGLDGSEAIPDQLRQQLRDFKGAAATIRFSDGGVELAVASDSHVAQGALIGGGTGGDAGDVVTSLPSDTAAAFGLGFEKGWFSALLNQLSTYTGESGQDVQAEIEQATGLSLPDDVETLAGQAMALSIGPDFDPSSIFTASSGSSGSEADLPLALKIKGDPDAITAVLAKLDSQAEQTGMPPGFLDTDTSGDYVAVGPDADYRKQVAADGSLGDSDAFKDVVPEADKASAILYLDLNTLTSSVTDLLGPDSDVAKNLDPLKALGLSSWTDGDVQHAVLRISTD